MDESKSPEKTKQPKGSDTSTDAAGEPPAVIAGPSTDAAAEPPAVVAGPSSTVVESVASAEPDEQPPDDLSQFSSEPSTKSIALPSLEEYERPSKLTEWPIWLISGVTFLSGLVGVFHPLFIRMSEHPRLFTALVPYSFYHWSRSLTAAFGLMLIYLSLNLFRRKRIAWRLSFAITCVSALVLASRIGSERSHWIHDADLATSLPISTIIPSIIALILLWNWRKLFTVRSESKGLSRAFKVVVLCLGIAIAYGVIGFWLLDVQDFGVNFTLAEAVSRTLREFTLQSNADLVPRTAHAQWFMQSLRLLGALAAVFAAHSIFRPLEYQLATLPRERGWAKASLDQFGRTALDDFKLLDDKSYYFTPDTKGFIAYRTSRNIAIALGDPVAPEDELVSLTDSFIRECHDNGWKVAFLQTTGDFLEMYKKLGLNVLKVGEDAVVNLERFCSTTINKKSFKAPVRKLEKQGFKLERMAPPHSPQLLDAVQEVSNEWLSLPGRRERGFSLGQFDRVALQKHTLYVLKDDKDKIIAFVDQIPSYKKGEATIDMMRHRVEVPTGSMDFLFAKLLVQLKEQGFQYFSLGLAALSGVGDQPNASVEEKAINLIYNHLNRFFSYKGLRRYKEKFEPDWEERFLIYEAGPPGLIRTAVALVKVTE